LPACRDRLPVEVLGLPVSETRLKFLNQQKKQLFFEQPFLKTDIESD